MRPLRVVALVLLATLGLSAFATTAFAQDEQGASVVVLKFERFNADEAVMKTFHEALDAGIEQHPDMYVKPGGEVTIKDLTLTAGCDAPTPECLANLRDLVDADRIVFGSVQRSDQVNLFTIRMFDFAEGRFTNEIVDQTIEGDLAKLETALPAVIEGFLYGNVGTLVVRVRGADATEIFFDGEKMGLAPTTLENLPLGEHVVSVKSRDGEEKSETVLLRHNQTASVNFVFGVEPPPPVTEESGPSKLPGWAAIGFGTVALGVGVYSSVQVVSAENARNEIQSRYGIVGGAFPDSDSANEAREAGDHIRHDEALQQRERFVPIQFIGYGVGGAAIAVGTFLLIRASNAESDTAPPEASRLDVGVSPTRGGVAGSLQLRF